MKEEKFRDASAYYKRETESSSYDVKKEEEKPHMPTPSHGHRASSNGVKKEEMKVLPPAREPRPYSVVYGEMKKEEEKPPRQVATDSTVRHVKQEIALKKGTKREATESWDFPKAKKFKEDASAFVKKSEQLQASPLAGTASRTATPIAATADLSAQQAPTIGSDTAGPETRTERQAELHSIRQEITTLTRTLEQKKYKLGLLEHNGRRLLQDKLDRQYEQLAESRRMLDTVKSKNDETKAKRKAKMEKLNRELLKLDKKTKDLKKEKSCLAAVESAYQKFIEYHELEVKELEFETKETSKQLDELYQPDEN